MVAYEVYFRNRKGEEHLLGVLPEQRKHPARITKKSVLSWDKLLMDGWPNAKTNNLHFERIEL